MSVNRNARRLGRIACVFALGLAGGVMTMVMLRPPTAATAAQVDADPELDHLEQLLNRVIPDAWIGDDPPQEAAARLQVIIGTPIRLLSRDDEAELYRPEGSKPKRMRLRTIEEIMDQFAHSIAGEWEYDSKLGFVVQPTFDGRRTILRTYRIDDLIESRQTTDASKTQPFLFCNWDARWRTLGDEMALADIIQENVAPDTWVDTGGRTGRLTLFGKSLIIHHTPQSHLQIRNLLAELRRIANHSGDPVSPSTFVPDSYSRGAFGKRASRRTDVLEARLNAVPPSFASRQTTIPLALAALGRQAGIEFRLAEYRPDELELFPAFDLVTDGTQPSAEVLRLILNRGARIQQRLEWWYEDDAIVVGEWPPFEAIMTRTYDLRPWLRRKAADAERMTPGEVAVREVEDAQRQLEATVLAAFPPDLPGPTHQVHPRVETIFGQLLVSCLPEYHEIIARRLTLVCAEPETFPKPATVPSKAK